MIRYLATILSVFILCLIASGQSKYRANSNLQKYHTNINHKGIKSLRVFVAGNQTAYPAIALDSDEKITISFDLLGEDAKDFSYQLIHCNHDWTTSELFSDEFMVGFNENPIADYDYSFNTKVPYVHYRVDLPNDDVSFLVSGNYALRIIEDDHRDSTILIAQFSVYEPLINIETEIVKPVGVAYKNSGQELRLTLHHEQLPINDPFKDIHVYVAQNNRPDRVLKDIKPVFVKNETLIYNYSGAHILPAGNEFRMIAFSDFNKPGLNVNDIRFVDTIYCVQARLDERRSYKKYVFSQDMNGKYRVNFQDDYDSELSADYAWVYFYLPIVEPFLDGQIFIYGALSNWQCNVSNQMQYNFDTKTYETRLLLKQGYYDYTYAFIDLYTKTIDETVLEGSHFETENDYVIYVYHRDFAQKYDRLVGYKVVNSNYSD